MTIIKIVLLVIALVIVILLSLYCYLSPGNSLPDNLKADSLKVIKSDRVLQIIKGNEVVKEYKIALGPNPKGHKTEQGDGKTPEGIYTIDYRNPKSKYHLSLHISYPNKADRNNAIENGRHPGGNIFIHGLPNKSFDWGRFHSLVDWTLGCIAITNEEIEELWRVCPNSTPIEIIP